MERVDPMLVEMASSSTGVAPPSSPNAMAVGLWDAQQLEVMSLVNPINPLLLASACVGSLAALDFLFRIEDHQEPPMAIPTRYFLDLLVRPAAAPAGSNDLFMLEAFASMEVGVDQPVFPSAHCFLKGVTPDGNTALHVVASHGGDNREFIKCACIINKRDQGLLFAVTKNGDTAFHCAARAGKSKMLACLIELGGRQARRSVILRKENVFKETALHDAVRIGNIDIVEILLEADPELANFPQEGTSPLYLSILLGNYGMAKTLYSRSNGNLSYSGPNGQSALHAATCQGTGFTGLVLEWNKSLTTHGDRDGSTPLHLASSFQSPISFRQLLDANPAPAYQADNHGLFPIHIAASMGRKSTIISLLEKFPSSAGLRTAQGRTFLHVAIEKKRLNIVSFVCQRPSLDWILNMQDIDGNIALHLAVQARKLRIFCSVFANKKAHSSTANNNNQTPLDISRSLLPRGMYYVWNSDSLIHSTLKLANAKYNCLREDQIEEKYRCRLTPEEKIKEAENVKDLSQMIGIGSVLIVTVAFGATFAVPGGFVADDHTIRGTPTLALVFIFCWATIAQKLRNN